MRALVLLALLAGCAAPELEDCGAVCLDNPAILNYQRSTGEPYQWLNPRMRAIPACDVRDRRCRL